MLKPRRVQTRATILLVAALAVFVLASVVSLPTARGATGEKFHKAPAAMREILDAPPTPLVSLSPKRDRVVLVQGSL